MNTDWLTLKGLRGEGGILTSLNSGTGGDFSTKFYLFLGYNLRRLVIQKLSEYILIFWEGRTLKRSNFSLKVEFFSFFFLKFGLV